MSCLDLVVQEGTFESTGLLDEEPEALATTDDGMHPTRDIVHALLPEISTFIRS